MKTYPKLLLSIITSISSCGRPVGKIAAQIEEKVGEGRQVTASQEARFDLAAERLESEKPIAEESLEASALKYVRTLLPRVAEQELSRPHVVSHGDLGVSVVFSRSINEIPVRNSLVEIFFRKINDTQFEPFEIYDRSYSDLPINSDAKVSAYEISQTDVGEILSQRTIYFASKDPASSVNSLILSQEIVTDSDTGKITSVVSLIDGKVLESFSERVHAGENILKAPVYVRDYTEAKKTEFPVPFVKMGTDRTLPDGSVAAGLKSQVTLSLDGDRFVVREGRSIVNFTADVSASGVATIPTKNLPAVNAYIALNRVQTFARQFLSEKESTVFKAKFAVTSNDTSGSCNAYYQGNSITLYAPGGGCAGMATVNDVIYHEWGHGIDDHTGMSGGISDSAFSEGIGDIIALHMTGDPTMGAGFFTSNRNGIRNLNNSKRHPQDKTGEPHATGLIIGGAFYDLRTAFIKKYGETKGGMLSAKYFLVHLNMADSYLESYDAVVRIDKTATNTTSGKSPNFCTINAAFAAHGLAAKDSSCSEETPQKRAVSVKASLLKSDASGIQQIGLATEKLDAASVQFCSIGTCTDAKVNGVKGARVLFTVDIPAQQASSLVDKDVTIKVFNSAKTQIEEANFRVFKR